MEELWHKLLSLFFIQLRLACRHQTKHRNVNGTLENLSSFTNENSGWLVPFNIHLNMLMWSKHLETTTKTFHFQWNFTACKCFYSETLLTISVFINGYCPSLFPHLMNSHFRWQWKLVFLFVFSKRTAIIFRKQWIYRLKMCELIQNAPKICRFFINMNHTHD